MPQEILNKSRSFELLSSEVERCTHYMTDSHTYFTELFAGLFNHDYKVETQCKSMGTQGEIVSLYTAI